MTAELAPSSVLLASLVTEREMAESEVLILDRERPFVTETKTGLVFAPDTPIEVWSLLAVRLLVKHKRIEWAIADAINFGKHAYGHVYAQWVQETGLSKKTLANIAWVGRQVESSRRREDVAFGIYAEVAALRPDQQDEVIEAAVAGGWNRYEVRDAAREVKAGRPLIVDAEPSSVDSSPVASDEPGCPLTLADLLPEWRQRAEACGQPHGYLQALIDTESAAVFIPGRWPE